MLLAVDIGNSAIKFGLFEDETLTSKFSIPTKRDSTDDEIRVAVAGRLSGPIDAAIVCSVVRGLEPAIASFLRESAGVEPTFVDNSFDFGLKINYEPLDSLGTDRLLASFAAVETYGAPCIVCSLGTATTIDMVNKDREFLGGVIAPGLEAMAEALHLKAPRLPRVDASRPPANLIGNSTTESIRSGIFNGYVAMIEGLIDHVTREYGEASRIATGGNARIVTDFMDEIDPDLILHGLRMVNGRRSNRS